MNIGYSLRFLVYAVSQAVRHPRTEISYYYCPECKIRISPRVDSCPACHRAAGNSPQARRQSPVPWWGCVAIIVIGIACWVVGGVLEIEGMDEAGRALVYMPLGALFGMSVPIER